MQPSALLTVLPPFERKRDVIVFGNQTLQQIITEVLDAHNRYASHYDTISGMFPGYAPKKLFDFCVNYLPYREEPGSDQRTKSPAAILQSGNLKNDCKHYAGFIGGVLDAINRTGKANYDWYYRFANYEDKPTYDHVFIVVGDDLWIDPTPIKDKDTGKYTGRFFNDRKLVPYSYTDIKPATMLSSIHGLHYYVKNDTPNACCNGAYVGDVTTTSQIQVSPELQAAAAADPEVAGAISAAQELVSKLPDGSLKDWVNSFLADPTGAIKSIIFGRTYNIGNYKLGEIYLRNILGMDGIQRETQVSDKYVPQAWAFFTTAMGVPVGSIDHMDQLVIGKDAYKSWANGTFAWVPDDQVIRANKILNQFIGWTPTSYPSIRDLAWNLSQFAAIPYIYPIWAVWDGNSTPKKFTGKHPITGQQFTDGYPGGTGAVILPIPVGGYISIVANNGLFCSTESGQMQMNANRTNSHGWEAFAPIDPGTGQLAFFATGSYVSAEGGKMYCDKSVAGPSEMFDVIYNPDGTFSLKGYNGMYVSSNNGDSPMTCDKPSITLTEKFRWQIYQDGQSQLQPLQQQTTPGAVSYNLPSGTTPGTVPVQTAGFGLIGGLVLLGLAGGVLYAANKKKKEHARY